MDWLTTLWRLCGGQSLSGVLHSLLQSVLVLAFRSNTMLTVCHASVALPGTTHACAVGGGSLGLLHDAVHLCRSQALQHSFAVLVLRAGATNVCFP